MFIHAYPWTLYKWMYQCMWLGDVSIKSENSAKNENPSNQFSFHSNPAFFCKSFLMALLFHCFQVPSLSIFQGPYYIGNGLIVRLRHICWVIGLLFTTMSKLTSLKTLGLIPGGVLPHEHTWTLEASQNKVTGYRNITPLSAGFGLHEMFLWLAIWGEK